MHKFLTATGAEDPTFKTVAGKLSSLSATLKAGQIKFQIVSQSPPLAYAVAKLVESSATLPALYQFQTTTLPGQSQRTEIPIKAVEYARTELAAPEPVLLQFTDRDREKPISHRLSKNGKLLIGRRPGCQIQIPQQYSFASGHHAEIVPVPGADNSFGNWQICDTSTNGTYINGQKISGCQTLHPDDRITLGYPEPTDRSAELIFKFEYNIASPQPPHGSAGNQTSDPNESLYKELIDCDILCLVINPTVPVSDTEKRLISRANQGRLFKTIAIVDVSAIAREPERVNHNIDAFKQWLKSQNLQGTVALPLIPLHPFYPSPEPMTELAPNVQQECDRFRQFLEQLAIGQREEILMQRFSKKIKEQIAIIEQAYGEKEANLKTRIAKSIALPPVTDLDELDRQIRKTFKQVAENKEKSFREIRVELNKSKSELVDGFSKESLLYKIKQFTDELQPVVTKEKDQVSLCLNSEKMNKSHTIHTHLNRLCYGDMSQWAKDEWQRVFGTYGDGGLQAIFQRTHAAFDFIPGLDLPSASFAANPEFDVYKCLQYSFVEFDNQVSFQDTASGNNLMLWGSAVMGIVGLAMGQPILLMTAGMGVLGKQVAQQQSETAKIEQITENLRKGLCQHYQSLAKSIADNLSQQINLAIEAEKRRFKTLMETTSDKVCAYMNDMKKGLDYAEKKHKQLQQ
ncbi:FHA domain-containing protein [Planktothricoides raciborskii]|uniref:FHA domain-containing protein n=1 Tax=Planktothricoides raciborskii FACHB-1370 TaxID=2949576 RepID=A0ABR8EHG3_9CYAN|nr:FHA domain-containing protein [Planktothricoides raciborskii]MBD2546309.1 FHA domain-containing protein [Planktothricoides raciborskii FACHB-1370]MBD2584216.1 FHA domain-containing protein [Planktothricoides raciborskii FACHB-1261]